MIMKTMGMEQRTIKTPGLLPQTLKTFSIPLVKPYTQFTTFVVAYFGGQQYSSLVNQKLHLLDCHMSIHRRTLSALVLKLLVHD